MKKITEKLPEDFKAKWIEALRSGQYKRGEGYLVESSLEGKRYCCLGVACVVAGCKQARTDFIHEYNQVVPEILRGKNPITMKLVKMNDVRLWSFKKIASWIEKNL